MTYDIVDKIYKPTGTMLVEEGIEYPEMAAVEGYHVNVLPQDDMSLVEPFIVEVNSLSRVFAGRDDTVALKFANRDEWLALGIEVIEVVE